MQFGWVDFSEKDRANALGFIQALRENGAVDELGIGILRDQIADRLFPGTSTLITRAKYYVLVPRLLQEATNGNHGWNRREVMYWLDEQERKAAKQMIALHKDEGGSNGIIGYMALKHGAWVSRPPSVLYWNGIRTFGICRGDFSLAEYVKRALWYRKNRGDGLGRARDEEDGSGDDRSAGEQYAFKPLDLKGLPTGNPLMRLDIELTPDEAAFLKNKILTNVSDSLLAFVLRNDDVDLDQFKDGNCFGAFADFLKDRVSERNTACLELAQKFAEFVYIARVRYNLIFQRGHLGREAVFDGRTAGEIWKKDFPLMQQALDYDFIGAINNLGFRLNNNLRRFIPDLCQAFKKGDLVAADGLIVEQEKLIKGARRSKLLNAKCYSADSWIGGTWLDYRLRDVAKIVRDIRNGLGGGR